MSDAARPDGRQPAVDDRSAWRMLRESPRWLRRLARASLVVGAASAAFVWWAAGAKFDAAESMSAQPAAAEWGGAAVVLFVLSGSVLLGCVIAATRRRADG